MELNELFGVKASDGHISNLNGVDTMARMVFTVVSMFPEFKDKQDHFRGKCTDACYWHVCDGIFKNIDHEYSDDDCILLYGYKGSERIMHGVVMVDGEQVVDTEGGKVPDGEDKSHYIHNDPNIDGYNYVEIKSVNEFLEAVEVYRDLAVVELKKKGLSFDGPS